MSPRSCSNRLVYSLTKGESEALPLELVELFRSRPELGVEPRPPIVARKLVVADGIVVVDRGDIAAAVAGRVGVE